MIEEMWLHTKRQSKGFLGQNLPATQYIARILIAAY